MPGENIKMVPTSYTRCKVHTAVSDGAKAPCAGCSQTNRRCGLRLSWPRPNDHRRAIVADSSSSSPTACQISDARFIHTSQWDIELYRSLRTSVPPRNLSLLHVPVSWKSSNLEAHDRDLFEYFCCVASASLATFDRQTVNLSNTLVEIALQGEGASATAVCQALLAFASLHRYGLQAHAVEKKNAALRSLSQGLEAPNLDATASIQHIATGMLLCSAEVYEPSCTLGQWTFYLGGVRTILNASCIKTLSQHLAGFSILLDWVHYHDVLDRFSRLHWKREGAREPPSTPTSLFSPQLSNLPPPLFSMLDLLAQVCETVSGSAASPEIRGNQREYKGFLEVLGWRIRSLPIPKVEDDGHDISDEATLAMHLYQLAILVFLIRSSQGLLDQPVKTQKHIDKAFVILSQLTGYQQHFPVFIIGCEAQTDEQRAIILDGISRTEKLGSSRDCSYLKTILQAVWAQDDLADGDNISYREKLTLVMSHYAIMPCFV